MPLIHSFLCFYFLIKQIVVNMIQNTIPFQPSRFASLRATTPVPVSWETIVNELTGPFHKVQTELYRQTIARLYIKVYCISWRYAGRSSIPLFR